ncbi:MAG: L,D-transpeptidase family protein [Chloroflexi bacterium]|nr:L,D-transpeptidase family protein [Chloroflexota bacterium]
MTGISRRDFLKLSALTLGGLAFTPFRPQLGEFDDRTLVRVATNSLSVYSKPDDTSLITGQWFRDNLLTVYEEVTADTPEYNPIWYRVWGGYVHRAHLQKVQVLYNRPLVTLGDSERRLAEVTVPYTRAMRFTKAFGWQPLYRLYYESVHWITSIDEGPDGEPWYRIFDELVSIPYHVPAIHLRPIMPEEYVPISPEVDFLDKRIDVDLTTQTLTAYEYDQVVLQTKISSGLIYGGKVNGIGTKTPAGTFHIEEKMPSKHMGDGNLAADIEAYELPGVPWTCFFTDVGHAFHGTYWHDNFGVPMSHGCVNMRTHEAKWLFCWARPIHETEQIYRRGYGTTVNIFYS